MPPRIIKSTGSSQAHLGKALKVAESDHQNIIAANAHPTETARSWISVKDIKRIVGAKKIEQNEEDVAIVTNNASNKPILDFAENGYK